MLNEDGNIISAEKETEIRKNLQNLMWVVWGEVVDLDSAELQSLYETYLEIIEVGLQGIEDMETTYYDHWCDGWNRFWGHDDYYGMRGWMAMINLMVDDYRFLYN